ncbi:esterase/lipase [Lachnospiraceae bacterium KM106-2]|nr:esterase/lipase [Lachnospiraceae bacterium KM106-2]
MEDYLERKIQDRMRAFGLQEKQRMQKEQAEHRPVIGKKQIIDLPGRSLCALVHEPEHPVNETIIFTIHGGGFMLGHCFDDDRLCYELMKKLRVKVVSLEYRLAPEFPYPAGVDDIYEQICLLASGKQVVLLGCSAGANLAVEAAYLGKKTQAFQVNGMCLNYPYLNLVKVAKDRAEIKGSLPNLLMELFRQAYVKDADETKIELTPLAMTQQEIQGLPPSFIAVAQRDNIKEDGIAMHQKLREAGVSSTLYEVENVTHGFIENTYNYDYVSENSRNKTTEEVKQAAYEIIQREVEFIKQLWR